MNRKTAMSAASLLVLLGSTVRRAAQAGEGRLRVLTFNVAGIPIIDATRSVRMAAIARELGKAGHDIALFQEAWLDKDARLLEREGGFFHKARRSGWPLGNGLLILSRFQIGEKALRLFTLKSPGSKDDWIERGVLAARVESPHGPWDVYTTHLTHVEDAAPVRLAQIFELAEFIREFSGDRPFLLGGDLNAAPESVEVKVLRGLLGVQDSCLGAEGERCGATSPESGRRIDYLFLADAGVLPKTAFGGTFAHEGQALGYSDHLGVEASLDPAQLSAAARPHPAHEQWALRTIADALASEIDRLEGHVASGGREPDGYTENPGLRSTKAVLERVARRLAAHPEDAGAAPAPMPEEVIRAAGRVPLRLDRSGEPAQGAPVVMIGHPGGLPAKVVAGRALMVFPGQVFFADLDSWGKNSGSPVIDSRTGALAGILIRGGPDYRQEARGCRAPYVCEGGECLAVVLSAAEAARR